MYPPEVCCWFVCVRARVCVHACACAWRKHWLRRIWNMSATTLRHLYTYTESISIYLYIYQLETTLPAKSHCLCFFFIFPQFFFFLAAISLKKKFTLFCFCAVLHILVYFELSPPFPFLFSFLFLLFWKVWLPSRCWLIRLSLWRVNFNLTPPWIIFREISDLFSFSCLVIFFFWCFLLGELI